MSTRGSQLVDSVAYEFDPMGRRTSAADVDGTTALTHDAAGRLTGATHPASSGLGTESFTYDDLGNRTSWNGSPAAQVQYDDADRLLGDGTYAYGYDAEGRVTTRTARTNGAVTTYRWNDAGKLIEVDNPGGTSSTYRYDPVGRRIEVNDAGTIRRFVYAGAVLHLQYDGANTLAAVYVAAPESGTTFEVVRNGAAAYPAYDAVGTATAFTDSAGAVVGRVRQSAYGIPHPSGTVDLTLGSRGIRTTGRPVSSTRRHGITTPASVGS